MMTDFKKLSMDELCARLCEKKMTLIIYHVRSDADAVGSAFALRELLHMLGSTVFCVCSDEVPERLRFLSEDVQGSVVPADGMGSASWQHKPYFSAFTPYFPLEFDLRHLFGSPSRALWPIKSASCY